MAYGIRYVVRWKARIEDEFYFNILQKDYVGAPTVLIGAGNVFNLSYDQEGDNITIPINASKGELNFFNEGYTPLTTFYSEDDAEWMGEFRDGLDDTILWRGMLVQDDCEEDYQPYPHVVSLSFTDNLGLLKDVTYDEAAANSYTDQQTQSGTINGGTVTITDAYFNPYLVAGDNVYINNTAYEITSSTYNDSTRQLQIVLVNSPANGIYDVTYFVNDNLIGKHTLFSFIRLALESTGIVLPYRVFNNLFETSQDESVDMFAQTRLFTGKYINDDGVWSDMYTILEEILTAFNATIIQAEGYWNVVRFGELYRYVSNELQGIEYDENFLNPQTTTLSPNFDTITPGTPPVISSVELINADARNSIRRPLKSVKETFRYEQPKQLIIGSDLKILGDFISTNTVDNLRYDRYEIPQQWSHQDGSPNPSVEDESVIVVVTDTDVDEEVERYIEQPWLGYSFRSLEFNPIEVSAGDYFNFSLSAKNITSDGTDFAEFKVRFLLIRPDGSQWQIRNFDPGGGADTYLIWSLVTSDPVVTESNWRTGIGVAIRFPQDENNYQTWDLSTVTIDDEKPKLPIIPHDGMLRIGIQGITDTNNTFPAIDVIFKDISLEFTNLIGDSKKVVGHTHLDDTDRNVKNKYDEDIEVDDSPRNTISGTLFTNDLSGFLTGIGYVYFTRTSLWGFRGETKDSKLGQLITFERHTLQKFSRTLLDCSFVFDCPMLNPLSVLFVSSLPGRNFIFGVASFDYMRFVAECRLIEVHEDDEADLDSEYTFEYLFEQS